MREFEFLDPEVILATDDFSVVRDFLEFTGRKQIGWHYIIDLTWIYNKVKDLPVGSKILDAGGGGGPAQFLLAEMGFNVTNIDLFPHAINEIVKNRYSVKFCELDSYLTSDYVEHLKAYQVKKAIRSFARFIRNSYVISSVLESRYYKNHDRWRDKYSINGQVGTILKVKGNLCSIPEMLTDSFDAVVSLSAVEHIPIDEVGSAIAEIARVVKDNGVWAVTTSASTNATWFHEPSKGYAYSMQDLNILFHASGNGDPNIVLQHYKESGYLKRNLADFYYKSSNNGMPNGNWDPKYIPVGIY